MGTTLTLQDGETLFVNGTEVELTDNAYTFNVEDNCSLSITDRAGNESHINVTIEHIIQEYEKWDYTLNDTDNTITLNSYLGDEEDVIVYSQYVIHGKEYKTKIDSYDEGYYYDKYYMFESNKRIRNIVFQNGIDSSNVTNMSGMFYDCRSLTLLDLSNLNTCNVKDMNAMFGYCTSLTSLDVSNFDTSKVQNMYDMFRDCTSLTSLGTFSFHYHTALYADKTLDIGSLLINVILPHINV